MGGLFCFFLGGMVLLGDYLSTEFAADLFQLMLIFGSGLLLLGVEAGARLLGRSS